MKPPAHFLYALKEQSVKFFAGLAQAMVIFALLGILILVVGKGLEFFWPKSIQLVNYESNTAASQQLFGYVSSERLQTGHEGRIWLNQDSWQRPRNQTQVLLNPKFISSIEEPENLARIDLNDGRFLLAQPIFLNIIGEHLQLEQLPQALNIVTDLQEQYANINEGDMVSINTAIASLRAKGVSEDSAAMQTLLERYQSNRKELSEIEKVLAQYNIVVMDAASEMQTLPLQEVRQVFYPNGMGFFRKLGVMSSNLLLFLTEDTRDANQSGGVFPAIFGTVLMVLLMAVIVSPLGIMAAIYLTEYAPNNAVVSLIRLAVSNLAAVPSVVYGVFGLGFFVYQMGGSIDELFYADTLPNPTFGTPGLLWASLTMALLTLPVVIVATEEGLRRVPESLRYSSYALGATRYETIRRIVLPVASSSLLTGIILAVARAAGEVAPMLMVGAVRYAPVLPLDGEFPYLHLERQFMHLGVLIYDGAFHGQSTQQGAGMMFATCLLLLLVVLILNFIAIMVRNRLQTRYGY
ncbi:phosphate ABC transporter permease PstA [Planctobacterium marinum]|uniref:Phosphate transport system permease protein PstA n=1 Tax=Planctobacterium marinum TaxID=1631968 RepID=A0AA48HFA8_9ALTE|nr:phosphate transport system permease protein PstA [Planctobacterium marinum]